MTTKLKSGILVAATILALCVSNVGYGQTIDPKVKPGSVTTTTQKKVLSVPPKVQPAVDLRTMDSTISAMSAMESDLDRAFAAFKQQHQRTLRVARESAVKNRECMEKVYRRRDITEADRRAVCRNLSQVQCESAVYSHCQAHETTNYLNHMADLELKRERLETLLQRYQRGAHTDSQADLLR